MIVAAATSTYWSTPCREPPCSTSAACKSTSKSVSALACSYIEGIGKEEFLTDKRTQQAVIMNLVIIGEAATKLLKDHA
jgi:hypothetical protein